ncbi:protein yippee-like 5 [Microdochium nivale]|nr:protein yippee-like 5 [Microdochium nivale]
MFSALRAVTGDYSGTSSTTPQPTGPKFPVYLLSSFAMPFRGRRQSIPPATEPRNNSISSTPPHETAVPTLSSSPSDSAHPSPAGSPTSPSSFTSRFTAHPPVTATNTAGRRASARCSMSTVSSSLSATSSSSFSSCSSSTTPAASHSSQRRRLSRTQPNTIRCSTCSSDFAYCSQVISKGFTGRYGRAYLVAPAPPDQSQGSGQSQGQDSGLLNVKIGRSETRLLVTGSHVVADMTCAVCQARIGWKYVDAKEESQKYKVGKYILETQRVVNYRSWEDLPESGLHEAPVADHGPSNSGSGSEDKEEAAAPEDVVVFDSEDEDDCDELFAGSWDPAVAARRRARRVNQRNRS